MAYMRVLTCTLPARRPWIIGAISNQVSPENIAVLVSNSFFPSAANEVAPKFRNHENNAALPELSDQNTSLYRTNIYQFHHWPLNGQIITQSVPIAIDPLFEEIKPTK